MQRLDEKESGQSFRTLGLLFVTVLLLVWNQDWPLRPNNNLCGTWVGGNISAAPCLSTAEMQWYSMVLVLFQDVVGFVDILFIIKTHESVFFLLLAFHLVQTSFQLLFSIHYLLCFH